MTHNNITGDKIATKAPTKAYRDGWEQAFGKKAASDSVLNEAEQQELSSVHRAWKEAKSRRDYQASDFWRAQLMEWGAVAPNYTEWHPVYEATEHRAARLERRLKKPEVSEHDRAVRVLQRIEEGKAKPEPLSVLPGNCAHTPGSNK
jgi:hypothetical protein